MIRDVGRRSGPRVGASQRTMAIDEIDLRIDFDKPFETRFGLERELHQGDEIGCAPFPVHKGLGEPEFSPGDSPPKRSEAMDLDRHFWTGLLAAEQKPPSFGENEGELSSKHSLGEVSDEPGGTSARRGNRELAEII